MNIIRNIPGLLKLFWSIKGFDHYAKDIEKARATGDPEIERKEIAQDTWLWSGDVADKFGMKVLVKGQENIPERDGLVFISNHQGYADIIAMFRALKGKQIGFIAKDSLQKLPYFGKWITVIRGLYIQRGNAKEALKSIQEGSKLVKEGYNLVIFPEGTRSQGPEMAHFKAGSFKLATKAKAMIVPVTIQGSYHLFEEKGMIRPGTVRVQIHPPIDTATLDRKQIAEMEKQVEDTIRTSLKELIEEESHDR